MINEASDPNPNPMNMSELSLGEVLVIRTLRRWALASDPEQNYRDMISEYRTLFLHDAVDAFSNVLMLVREIASGARRRMSHHTTSCPCFSADEIALVTLVASVQANESQLARKFSAWLVDEDQVPDVMAAAGRVAFIFSGNAVELPLRREGQSVSKVAAFRGTHAAHQTVH